MITIVDYGLGNVLAIANIYRRLELPVTLATSAAELAGATRLILPGVGAFDWAMTRLNRSGMRDALDRLVLHERVPVLGICVGMQMMATRSDEGKEPGLGWFDATIKLFDERKLAGPTRLPHMGWNDVVPTHRESVFRGFDDDVRFYFLHSYFFSPNDSADILATSSYGDTFACAVQRRHIVGVQFHPEKSHGWGISLLKNFGLDPKTS
jgi:glutamine amidotransferase